MMFNSEALSEDQLDEVEALIEAWLEGVDGALEKIGVVESVQRSIEFDNRGERERRWYVRVRGEEKDVWTIWMTLAQRTLRYETYLVPAPEENHAVFYEHLLRRNRALTGLQLEIGPEDAIYLAGAMPAGSVNNDALDWMLGALYQGVELIFRPAMRIGYESKFKH